MPGRDTTFGSSKAYRFGFNGKEMDNDAYGGHGNEYDYGFRIYNPRIGKFLSVDPLQKKYPYYSSYQFAGDGPISNKDADGGEPQSYTWDWQKKQMFDLKSKQALDENGGYVKTVDDPNLGYVDVEMVYDNVTKQNWFIHQDNQGNYYYLKNDNGHDDVLTLKAGTIHVSGGSLQPFETYNQVAYEQTDALLKGIATGAAGAVVLPFAIEGAPTIASLAWKAYSNPYVQFALGGDIGGSYAYEYANGNGQAVQEEMTVTNSSPATSPVNTKSEPKPEPLDWSRVNPNTGEKSPDHVNLHGQDNLAKRDHGIFYGDPVETTDKAWALKGNIQPVRQPNGNDAYLIPYPNAGYSGGANGTGENLNYVKIITEGGTNKVVTSFPVKQ